MIDTISIHSDSLACFSTLSLDAHEALSATHRPQHNGAHGRTKFSFLCAVGKTMSVGFRVAHRHTATRFSSATPVIFSDSDAKPVPGAHSNGPDRNRREYADDATSERVKWIIQIAARRHWLHDDKTSTEATTATAPAIFANTRYEVKSNGTMETVWKPLTMINAPPSCRTGTERSMNLCYAQIRYSLRWYRYDNNNS